VHRVHCGGDRVGRRLPHHQEAAGGEDEAEEEDSDDDEEEEEEDSKEKEVVEAVGRRMAIQKTKDTDAVLMDDGDTMFTPRAAP